MLVLADSALMVLANTDAQLMRPTLSKPLHAVMPAMMPQIVPMLAHADCALMAPANIDALPIKSPRRLTSWLLLVVTPATTLQIALMPAHADSALTVPASTDAPLKKSRESQSSSQSSPPLSVVMLATMPPIALMQALADSALMALASTDAEIYNAVLKLIFLLILESLYRIL